MSTPDKEAFLKVWPRCFLIFLAIVELLAALVLIATELGNVAANFWITNVFAGGWGGVIMLIHCIALCIVGCCAKTPTAAFVTVIITIVALVSNATVISFDAVFIAQPSTCILTPSCNSNAYNQTLFSYYFQQSFFTLFNNLSTFKTYTLSQAKFLFQTIQLGVGCLCFILNIIYLIIYYVAKSKASKQVSPAQREQQRDYYAPQPSYPSQQQQQQQQQQSGGNYYRAPPRAPQAPPGDIPWTTNRRY